MSHKNPAKSLAPKQWRFVEEYLLDLNASQAALRAGYSARGVRVQATRLLANASVQAAIAQAQAARARRVHLSQDTVLREIALLATSTLEHYTIDDAGQVHVREGSPEGAVRAIASLKKTIRHTETGVTYETEIKLWNKPASLRMAGEHLGLLTGSAPVLPDIHVHVYAARERLADRLTHLATRHAEDARNGH